MADYGAQDTSTTSLGANQFPISEAWTPNAGFSAVEGGTQTTDAGGKKSAPARIEVKDGSDVSGGSTTDAAVTGDNPGTRSAKLRGLTKILTDIWDSVNHRIKVDGSGVTQPVSGTFWQTTQPVSGTVTANAGSGTFTNQQSNVQADYDTGAGTQNITMQGIALPASGGAVSGGTSTNPVRTDPTGTTVQPVSGTFWQATQPVSGTFWQATQPVSGTVSITANSAVNVAQIGGTNIVTGGASGLMAVGGPVASGATNADNPIKAGGVFNTTQPTVTNGQVVDAQYTSRGAQIVSTGVDTFTVTANAGTNLNTSLLALESGGHLANIDTHTPAQGQNTMVNSSPVVVASDQSAIPVKVSTSALYTLASTVTSGATQNSGDLAVGSYHEVSIDINTTAQAGTSPTIQYFFERKGADAIYYVIWQSAVLTAAANTLSTSVGPGLAYNQSLGNTDRLRWVVGGSVTPTFTHSLNIYAK